MKDLPWVCLFDGFAITDLTFSSYMHAFNHIHLTTYIFTHTYTFIHTHTSTNKQCHTLQFERNSHFRDTFEHFSNTFDTHTCTRPFTSSVPSRSKYRRMREMVTSCSIPGYTQKKKKHKKTQITCIHLDTWLCLYIHAVNIHAILGLYVIIIIIFCDF